MVWTDLFWFVNSQWRHQGWARGTFAPSILSSPPVCPPNFEWNQEKMVFSFTEWSKLMTVWASCPPEKFLAHLLPPSPNFVAGSVTVNSCHWLLIHINECMNLILSSCIHVGLYFVKVHFVILVCTFVNSTHNIQKARLDILFLCCFCESCIIYVPYCVAYGTMLDFMNVNVGYKQMNLQEIFAILTSICLCKPSQLLWIMKYTSNISELFVSILHSIEAETLILIVCLHFLYIYSMCGYPW